MADETPELIEQRMHGTRQSLADKLGALETAVSQTIANTTHAVQETVESVRSSVQEATGVVQDTVGGVRSLFGGGGSSDGAGGAENAIHNSIQSLATTAGGEIRDAVDITPQIREKPWQYVGGAVAIGFVAGYFFGPSRLSGGGVQAAYAAPGSGRPGLFDDLVRMLGQEVRKVGENAISSLSQSVNQSVKSAVPKIVDSTVSRVVDAAGQGATRPPADAPRDHGYGQV